MAQVSLQKFFQSRLEFVKRNATENLASDGLIWSKSAPDKDMIPFERFSGDFDFCPEQANVAHVMLRAGIGAASQVNIERLIEFDIRVIRHFPVRLLGNGRHSRPLKSGISGLGVVCYPR